MKHGLSFTYTLMETPPRCRKPRPVQKNGHTEVHVNELNAGQLPVAFVVHHFDEEKVVRFYDDKFFTVSIVSDGNGQKKRLTVDALKRRLDCAARQSWNDSSVYDICDELQKIADGYIIIGDTVYEKIGEPRYCIYTFGLGYNHGGTSLSVDYHFNENIPSERYFPANEYEKAVDTAHDIALLRGDTESFSGLRNHEYIDVIDSKYVSCNPKQHTDVNPFMVGLEKAMEGAESIEDAARAVIAYAMK